MTQGTADYILEVIRITPWIQERFEGWAALAEV